MRSTPLIALALAFPPALGAQDGSVLDRIRAAMNLPVVATEARDAGVPDERVRRTIGDILRGGIPAGDASDILDEEVREVRAGGSGDNFGAYVRSQVESGLRGRQLADAIHREQGRRGMGRPDGAARASGGGRPDAAGRPDGAGRPGNRDARQGGRPDSAARSDADRPQRGNAGAARGRQP